MEALLFLLGKACLCVALVSGIPLGVTAAVGLVVAVVQAATQVQEQSFLYLTKLVTVGVLFFLTGSLLLQYIVAFFVDVFTSFHYLGVLA